MFILWAACLFRVILFECISYSLVIRVWSSCIFGSVVIFVLGFRRRLCKFCTSGLYILFLQFSLTSSIVVLVLNKVLQIDLLTLLCYGSPMQGPCGPPCSHVIRTAAPWPIKTAGWQYHSHCLYLQPGWHPFGATFLERLLLWCSQCHITLRRLFHNWVYLFYFHTL